MNSVTSIPTFVPLGRSPSPGEADAEVGGQDGGAARLPLQTPAGGPAGGSGGQARLSMRQRLPGARAVDRDEFLLAAAAGRSVTHVGFADAGMRDFARRNGRWLHARLDEVARGLVGVDIEHTGVAEARALGYEAHVVDCRDAADIARAAIRPAELLIVGEVIEHVDSVGPFLDGLRALVADDGEMIVTTPNACRLLNVIAALAGHELVHPDHVSWYSWYTLVNVLERHGWRVVDFQTYQSGPAASDLLATRLAIAAERAAARLFAPFLANGLIAVCKPATP